MNGQSPAGSRPNVVVLVSHDMGQHVGCYGVPTVQTPHIDRLAAEGARFARSFCCAPQCSPSRAGLFTGRYPHSNGMMGLAHGRFAWDLHPGERHLAGRLRQAGYHTALLGHQHETRRPSEMGFDIVSIQRSRAADMAESAAEFLRTQAGAGRPFYLQLGCMEPHRLPGGFGCAPDEALGVTVPPFLVDEPSAREEFAGYQGAIRAVDQAVGRTVEAMERAGLAENTIFLLTTDHGMPFPRAKCSLYEPGLQVCLILSHPAGLWGPGRVCQEMISNIDCLPTLLELLDVPAPQAQSAGIQGRSFAALLRGQAYQPRREVFAEMTYHQYYDPMRCVRTQTHKLIVHFSMAPSFMDPSQTWRPRTITRTPPDPAGAYHEPVELYDLAADPWETRNLARESGSAKLCRGLLARVHEWMVQTGDPLLEGIPPSPSHRAAIKALTQGDLDWPG